MYKTYFVCLGVVLLAMGICLIPNGPKLVSAKPKIAKILPSETGTKPGRVTLAKAAPSVRRSLGFFEVTAYCPDECCCGEFADGVTASGVLAVGKFVAADKAIPFYKVLDVPEYGKVPVLDRGGKIRGKKLDVFFPTHDEALEWGRRTIEIYCWVEK